MATFQTDSLVEFYDNVYEHQCELIFLWTCQISQTESYLSSEKRRKRNNYRKWEAVIYSRFERIWTMFAIIFQSHFPLWNHPIISVSIKEDDIHEPIKLHGFLHNVGYFFLGNKKKWLGTENLLFDDWSTPKNQLQSFRTKVDRCQRSCYLKANVTLEMKLSLD